MRTMLLTSALGLSIATLCAPAPARADGFAAHQVMRLSAEMSQVDRLNRSRSRDQVYAAIAHQIDMINDRIAELQGRRVAPGQALSMIDDSLYAILQYNQNAGYEAPWASAQIRRIVTEMRAEVAALRDNGTDRGGRGYGRGYDRGYGQTGDGQPSYGQTGYGQPRYNNYVPPPAPAERYYVPPPAPAYTPAPPAYRQEPCDDPNVQPVRY